MQYKHEKVIKDQEKSVRSVLVIRVVLARCSFIYIFISSVVDGAIRNEKRLVAIGVRV